MVALEEIKPGSRLRGLDSEGIAEVVQVARFGADALNLVFRVNGRVGERLVYRGEEAAFEQIDAGRAYAFDADGGLLRLASEAYRIRLAYLFDPYLAVSASQIEALPHQITAVYGEMLTRQPLRFLLADDPGAGKTIMAGLLIKELLIRGDLERCLIVAPGALVEQWQEELIDKFGLAFELLTRDQIEASITGNPFVERSRLIVRLDMAARSDELRAKLEAAPDWDLIVCDEAHRMAASYFGGEVKETQRYKLGKLLGTRARNFLLMSATPHNGKEADFQLFMGLLDADRFEGRFREGVHKADVSDMMRRLTKEELYRFDGTRLFPERLAYTASYALSPAETDLYQAVTTYVREEMNRADRTGDDKRRMNVGFALQILQRRLASSPAAIHRSLERQRKRLEERLREDKLMRRGTGASLAQSPALPAYDPEDADEVPGAEAEAAEEQILDQATAAQTLVELEAEIGILTDLEARALRLKLSGQDAKWRELESILDHPIIHDPATGLRRKILIFTEPRDTLDYLTQKIGSRLGDPASGPAPYLDCRSITADEKTAAVDAITAPWLSRGVENLALGYAVAELVPAHLAEVKERRLTEIDKVEREVRARLTREINYWDARAARLREEERAGKEQRINAQNAEATAQRLVERLHKRQAELGRERQISALPPVLKGAALVIPRGLIDARTKPGDGTSPTGFSDDPVARAEIERLAMEAVMAAERRLGNTPRDVSAEKKGYDIESRDPGAGHLRFIEVKGRHADARDVIVTKNEILASLNAPDTFFLAIVPVDSGFVREPVYVQRFFKRELGFAETAVVFNIDELISLGSPVS